MHLDCLDSCLDGISMLTFDKFSWFHRALLFLTDLIFRTMYRRKCCNDKTIDNGFLFYYLFIQKFRRQNLCFVYVANVFSNRRVSHHDSYFFRLQINTTIEVWTHSFVRTHFTRILLVKTKVTLAHSILLCLTMESESNQRENAKVHSAWEIKSLRLKRNIQLMCASDVCVLCGYIMHFHRIICKYFYLFW